MQKQLLEERIEMPRNPLKYVLNLVLSLNRSTLIKNSYYLMASSLLGMGSGFLFWLIAARIYLPSHVGIATATISAMNLIAILSLIGLNYSVVSYLPEEKNKSDVINTSFTILTLVSFALSILFIMGIEIWSPALNYLRSSKYAPLFILFAVVSTLALFQGNVFLSFRNARYTFFQNMFTTVRLITLPLLASAGEFGIFLSYGLGVVISFIVGNLMIRKFLHEYKPWPRLMFNKIKEMLIYSLANYITYIFEMLPTYVLPLIILNFLGPRENAYFYIAWMFSGILLMVPRSVSMSLFVEGTYKEDLIGTSKKALLFIFLILSIGILGVRVFGSYLLGFFGEEYKAGYSLLILLSYGSIPYSFIMVYVAIKRAQRKVIPLVLTYSLLSISIVGLSYMLVPVYGINGVGYSWISGNLLVLVCLLATFLKHKISR